MRGGQGKHRREKVGTGKKEGPREREREPLLCYRADSVFQVLVCFVLIFTVSLTTEIFVFLIVTCFRFKTLFSHLKTEKNLGLEIGSLWWLITTDNLAF